MKFLNFLRTSKGSSNKYEAECGSAPTINIPKRRPAQNFGSKFKSTIKKLFNKDDKIVYPCLSEFKARQYLRRNRDPDPDIVVLSYWHGPEQVVKKAYEDFLVSLMEDDESIIFTPPEPVFEELTEEDLELEEVIPFEYHKLAVRGLISRKFMIPKKTQNQSIERLYC